MPNESINVLVFSLGDDRYGIDIDHVEEIVDAEEEITPLPNAEEEVVGVVDLRGKTTTIVDPKVSLDLDADSEGNRIVVLSDVDETGLLIDEVHEVIEVDEATVDETSGSESTRGVIRHDDRFVIWIEPTTFLD